MTRPSGSDELVYLPLGGAGEIGMNLYLYGYGPADSRQWIIVDIGVGFAGPELPGIDLVCADTAFIESERHNLLAIVLTHAHEDHYGALALLWPRLQVPVYATAFSAALLRSKLDEAGLLSHVTINEIKQGARFDLGPFDIEYITMTHSIPEPNALAIRTPLGNILHTGDWRLDPRPVVGLHYDVERLRAFGREGVRAMICDSPNLRSHGDSGSESDVAENLTRIIGRASGRVAVTTFASNAGRLLSIMRAAHAAGRHVVLAGRSMHRIVGAALDTGCFVFDGELLSEDDFGYLPPDKVLLLCTGSQGEPRAALARIAAGTHPRIALEAGDTVIFSSKTIPGNEKAVGRVENDLAALGAIVIDNKTDPVHVTGHPRRNEVRQLYGWIRPEAAIPMHGETLHLTEHARFARHIGIPESIVAMNGDMIRIAPGPLEKIDEAPGGKLCLDGTILLPTVNTALRERRSISFAGCLSVVVVLDRKNALLEDPVLNGFGLPGEDADGQDFETLAYDAIDDVLDATPRKRRNDAAALAEMIRRRVRGAIRNSWGKKPIVRVEVLHV
jgi:ribonuclease J